MSEDILRWSMTNKGILFSMLQNISTLLCGVVYACMGESGTYSNLN